MYTCGKIEELLDIYADGELDEPGRLGVEAHIQGCSRCGRLARLREEEAELIRSGDPAPALTSGFTGRVMSGVAAAGRPVVYELRFFSPRRLLARPWLSPALAGLVLLAAVSWAASRQLIATNTGQVASRNQAQVSLAPANGELDGDLKTGSPAPGAPLADIDSDSDRAEVYDKQAAKPKLPQGFNQIIEEEDAQAGSGRANPAVPQSSREESAEAGPKDAATPVAGPSEAAGSAQADSTSGTGGASGAGGMTAGETPPPRLLSTAAQGGSLEELERQGYTLFAPAYLPPGYAFISGSPQPRDAKSGGGGGGGAQAGGGVQAAAPLPARDNLLLTYAKAGTGGQMTLEIRPLAGPVPQPAPGPAANAPSAPQGAGGQITWYAQKHGNYYLLKLTGSLPYAELKRVADSVL